LRIFWRVEWKEEITQVEDIVVSTNKKPDRIEIVIKSRMMRRMNKKEKNVVDLQDVWSGGDARGHGIMVITSN